MCSEDKSDRTAEKVGKKSDEAEAETTEGRYVVFIEGARGLRRADWFPGMGTSDCYVVLKEDGKDLYTTAVIKDCLDPVWQETAEISHEDGKALEFCILDKDAVGSNDLGKVVVDAKDFETTGTNKEFRVEGAGSGGQPACLKIKIKKASRSEYPPGPLGKLSLTIEKGDCKSYGLDLDTQCSSTLLVSKVKPGGAFELYNKGKQPDEQLRKDDFIMSVGGETGSAAMLEKFRTESKLALEVRRPAQVAVCLDRPEVAKPIGVEYGKKPPGYYLAVQSINSGLIKEYNEGVTDKDLEIKVGDFIVACGGSQMKAQALAKTLNDKTGRFQLSVIRPWEEETSRWSFLGFGE